MGTGTGPDPEFILPSVFHGSGWCHWLLAKKEICMVFDVSHRVVEEAGKWLSLMDQHHI
jgi:hypothetical protein